MGEDLQQIKAQIMAIMYQHAPALPFAGFDEMLGQIIQIARSENPHLHSWQPMETMPENGQVLVCWNNRPEYDTIGKAEYLECVSFGEPLALGWMLLPAAPERS